MANPRDPEHQLTLTRTESIDPKCGLVLPARAELDFVPKRKATDPLGQTFTTIEIEYALDRGRVTLGCATVRATVTLFGPFVDISEFEANMERLDTDYGGDEIAFSADPLNPAHSFPHKQTTFRHERMHVDSYRLCARDTMWPRYKDHIRYLTEHSTTPLTDRQFREHSAFFWKSWSSEVERIIPHKRIHQLDLLNLIEEFRRRDSD